MEAAQQDSAQTFDLARGPLAKLFFGLLKQRFTGTLTIEQAELGARHIYLRGGMPIYTNWRSATDTLGEIMLSQRMISSSQLNTALSTLVSQGGRLGDVLRQMGWVDETKLSQLLLLQCTRKLRSLFRLRSGLIEIRSGEHGLGENDDLKGQVNVLALIWQGISTHYRSEELDTLLQPLGNAPIQLHPNAARYLAHFGFPSSVAPCIERLRQGAAISTFVGQDGCPDSGGRQLAFTLMNCEMLQVHKPASVATPARPARPAAAPAQHAANQATSRPSTPAQTAPPATNANGAASSSSALKSPDTSGTKSIRSPMRGRPSEPSTPTTAQSSKTAAPRTESATNSNARGNVDRAKIEPELAAIEKRIAQAAHPFALFELPIEADRAAIRSKWAQLSREFHPDKFSTPQAADLKPRVQRVFAELSGAYSMLSNKEQREMLRVTIKMGGKINQDSSVASQANDLLRQTMRAEGILRDGERWLKKNSYAKAQAHYQEVLEILPDDPDALAGEAWCSYQLAQRTPEAGATASQRLLKATQIQPKCASAWFFLGQIQLNLGQVASATTSLEKAVALDSRNVDAQRFLRVAQQTRAQPQTSSREETNKPKGLFGGLLGGKR